MVPRQGVIRNGLTGLPEPKLKGDVYHTAGRGHQGETRAGIRARRAFDPPRWDTGD